MRTFWEFVDERMKIHERRAANLPRPWTDDPVLRDNFFTNCVRELDPGTDVALDIVSRRRPAEERLWNLILYRRLNRESTWRAIGGYLRDVGRSVEPALRRVVGPVFTGAHQVNALQAIVPGRDIVERQARAMRPPHLTAGHLRVLAARLREAWHARDAFDAWRLAGIPGVGAFLSWQLALDSRMGPRPLAEFSDDEWAPVQAGALAGLKIVFSNNNNAMPKSYAEQLLITLRGWPENTHNLTVAAVEHSLCEYSKYVRIASGGHSKGRYDGR